MDLFYSMIVMILTPLFFKTHGTVQYSVNFTICNYTLLLRYNNKPKEACIHSLTV